MPSPVYSSAGSSPDMLKRLKAKARDLQIKAVVGTALMKENRIINAERKAAAKAGTSLLDRIRFWGAVARIMIVLCRYYGPEVLRAVALYILPIRMLLTGLRIAFDLMAKAAKTLKLVP